MSLRDVLISPLERVLPNPLRERGIRLPAPPEQLIDGNIRRFPEPVYAPSWGVPAAHITEYQPRPIGSWAPPRMVEPVVMPPPQEAAAAAPPDYQSLTPAAFDAAYAAFLHTPMGARIAAMQPAPEDEPDMPASGPPSFQEVAAGVPDPHDPGDLGLEY